MAFFKNDSIIKTVNINGKKRFEMGFEKDMYYIIYIKFPY